jgi:hypothetical protein
LAILHLLHLQLLALPMTKKWQHLLLALSCWLIAWRRALVLQKAQPADVMLPPPSNRRRRRWRR